MKAIWDNWRVRHRHPASLALHAVGIPMLAAGLLLGAWQLWHGLWPLWWRPVGLIVLSYVLQGLGHAMEGNDMGEVVLLKKLLGRPYVAIAPSRDTGSQAVSEGAVGRETAADHRPGA